MMLTTRDIFLAFIFTIFGVFVREHFSIGIIFVLIVILSCVFWKTKSKVIFLSMIAGLILGVGATFFHKNMAPSALSQKMGQKISGTAEVISSKQNLFNIQYAARIKINDTETKAILETNNFTPLSIGDTFNFSGTLTEPENFVGEYGKIFDYKNYLRSKGIHYVVKNVKWYDISYQQGFSLVKILENIKLSFESHLEKVLHEPAVSLVEGMLIGDKGAMTKADSDSFRKSGLIHMVVLSGYNISVVMAFMLSMLRKAGRKISLISAGVTVILFVILTGASATAVRAGVMGVLVILGNIFHRKLDILRLLSITGILMTIISPLSALYDPSFQLSFLATFGLVSFSGWAGRKIYFVTEKYGIREIVSATIGSQIMTLPYLAYSVGAVSVVSLFANVLVLPFAPAMMLSGFLTGLFSFIPIIYTPFVFITSAISSYIFSVSNFFAKLPFAMLNTSIINGLIIFILYIPLCFVGYKLYTEEKLRERNK